MTSKTSKHESRKAVNEDVQLTPKLVTVNTKWRNLSDIQRGNEVNILTSDGTGFTCFHKRRVLTSKWHTEKGNKNED